MKKNSIITLLIILLVAGGLTYGIIWFMNRKKNVLQTGTNTGTGDNSNTEPGSDSNNNTEIDTGNNESLPPINSYGWWENKLGRAGFPLKYGSKGVEVVKLQEELNLKSAQKPSWGLSDIAVDGIWGSNTDTRFKLFYPGYSNISEYMFLLEFDPMMEILK